MSTTKTCNLQERKKEEQVGKLRNVARHKRGLTNWRGGRGRSGLVSFKTWHVTNEDSPTGGEEEGGGGWWASKQGTSKRKNQEREGGEEGEGAQSGASWVSDKERRNK